MKGIVTFEFRDNSWRVVNVLKGGVSEMSVRVFGCETRKVLTIAGAFAKRLRNGQFCKRPHTLLTHMGV
jgi:hypothetical protein